jgi:hypothetical protein
MPLETGLWRAGADVPVRAGAPGFPLESRLEELIQSDPTILGEPLLVSGGKCRLPTASSLTCWQSPLMTRCTSWS